MDFEEVILDDDGLFEDVDYAYDDPSDIDAFHKYWMDVADPRGTYLESLAAFKFEQASGSGEWDY